MSQTTRRKFLKLFAFIAAAPITSRILSPSKAFAAEEVVKLDDPTAVALGYHHDAEKVDVKKWTKKAGEDAKSHNCSNCRFVQGDAKKVDGQDGKWVGCQLFPGKLVNNHGWCNSWTAKA